MNGRVAVVTGARGGIGAVLAGSLESAGYTVARSDLRIPDGQSAPSWFAGDVTSRVQMHALAQSAVDAFGQIDLWVNNAGYLQRGPALEVDENNWDRTLDVNLKGAFWGSQAAATAMRQTGGSIVNLSSYAGLRARTECPAYAAAKAGVAHLTKSLALERAEYGIRVNAIAPGYIETPMIAWLDSEPGAREEFTSRTPMARLGMPAEVVDSIEFLASDKARYITGQILGVDGGITLA